MSVFFHYCVAQLHKHMLGWLAVSLSNQLRGWGKSGLYLTGFHRGRAQLSIKQGFTHKGGGVHDSIVRRFMSEGVQSHEIAKQAFTYNRGMSGRKETQDSILVRVSQRGGAKSTVFHHTGFQWSSSILGFASLGYGTIPRFVHQGSLFYGEGQGWEPTQDSFGQGFTQSCE